LIISESAASVARHQVRKSHQFRAIVVIADKVTNQNKAFFPLCYFDPTECLKGLWSSLSQFAYRADTS